MLSLALARTPEVWRCPKRHALVSQLINVPGCLCDECNTSLPKGSSVLSCRICDYDLCTPCSQTDKSKENETVHETHDHKSTPSSRIRCPQGHVLFPVPIGAKAAAQGVICDVCDATVTQGHVVRTCQTCMYDMCVPCYESVEGKLPDEKYDMQCARGHNMSVHATPNASYACDVCDATLAKGQPMVGCRPCNYDVCLACQHLLTVKIEKKDAQYNIGLRKALLSYLPFPTEIIGLTIGYDHWHFVLRCPSEHLFVAYISKWAGETCSVCAGSSPKGTLFICCKLCSPQQRVCQGCEQKVKIKARSWRFLTCPAGHMLSARHKNPHSPVVCDVCNKRCPIGSLLAGCRDSGCDYDICEACQSGAKQPRDQV